MTRKSPALQRAEAKVEMLQQGIVDQRGAIQQKDIIIEDIHAAEKRLIDDIDDGKVRIDELEMENTKLKLDEVMAGWALKEIQLKLERALGWIDHSTQRPLGATRVAPAPSDEEAADED